MYNFRMNQNSMNEKSQIPMNQFPMPPNINGVILIIVATIGFLYIIRKN